MKLLFAFSLYLFAAVPVWAYSCIVPQAPGVYVCQQSDLYMVARPIIRLRREAFQIVVVDELRPYTVVRADAIENSDFTRLSKYRNLVIPNGMGMAQSDAGDQIFLSKGPIESLDDPDKVKRLLGAGVLEQLNGLIGVDASQYAVLLEGVNVFRFEAKAIGSFRAFIQPVNEIFNGSVNSKFTKVELPLLSVLVLQTIKESPSMRLRVAIPTFFQIEFIESQ